MVYVVCERRSTLAPGGRVNRFIGGALAITGLTSCAAAAAPTSAPTPAPASTPLTAAALKPPLDTLAFYVGSWQCKGTFYPTKEEPEETKWEATLTVEPELGGAWLSVKMHGPGESRSVEHKGYDATAKKWIHLAVTASGGWSLGSSTGWNGSEMVWLPADPTEKTRATFTKLSETSYSHVVTIETDKGVEKYWDKVCTKM
jgi:hypothetical protein